MTNESDPDEKAAELRAAGRPSLQEGAVMTPRQLHQVRRLLCRLQDAIRDALLAARDSRAAADFARVAAVTAADTIYQVDRISEKAILDWFEAHWPASWPVELVMEGLEGEAVTFPRGTPVGQDGVQVHPGPDRRHSQPDVRQAFGLGCWRPSRRSAAGRRTWATWWWRP